MNIYTIGKCKQCERTKPLKNGKCKDCEEELPDIFKTIFGDKK